MHFLAKHTLGGAVVQLLQIFRDFSSENNIFT